MTQVTIEYYGVVGKGRNVTEAKRDAGARIAESLEGEYTPVLIRWRGTLAIMAREPKTGWGYRLIHEAKRPVERIWLNGGYSSREECLRSMLLHIACNEQVEGEDTADELFDSAGLPSLLTRDIKREFADRAKRDDMYRRRRRVAVEKGLSEVDMHDFTLMNPSRFELWKGTENI